MPKVKRLDVANWLRQCPECNYQNGFHVSFHRTAADDQSGEVDVRLICPSCSAVFDVGLKARLATVT